MVYKVALCQMSLSREEDITSKADAYISKAASLGCSIAVFPECMTTPLGLPKSDFLALAQDVDGCFSSSIMLSAKKNNIWVLYTLIERNGSSLPFNTAVIVDNNSNIRAVYRKVHLFNSGTECESSKMTAGNEVFKPIQTPFGKIGMGICYDLRFPEFTRAQSLLGCDVMFYPSAWVKGPNKAEQWKTLLRARAVENEMYVCGVSRCDDGRCGRSCAFDPNGEVLCEASEDEELLIANIDLSKIGQVRQSLPVFKHRRSDLY